MIKTAGVLIIKEGKVLLVKHGEKASHLTNTYGLPAGRLQEGETDMVAAIRELEEETGLIAKEQDLVKIDKEYSSRIKRKDGEKEFSLVVFRCNKYFGELKSNNETTPEFVEIGSVNNLNTVGSTKKIIKDFIQDEFKKTEERS